MSHARLRRPGRLPNVSYVGIQRYFLTLCTVERQNRFVDRLVVEPTRSQLLRTAERYRFAVLAYCFMPDHVHLLAEGESCDSDLEKFVSATKQKSGYWFSRVHHGRLWQDGYYEHILRSDETTMKVVRYILENPVRAGLAVVFDQYAYSGSSRYSLAELADAFRSQG